MNRTKKKRLQVIDVTYLEKVSGGQNACPNGFCGDEYSSWTPPAQDNYDSYDYTGGAGYGWITEGMYY